MPATKDEIAGKFMELAFRYGYRRTSIEDVARALRISKKTVYDHFAGKDDLFRHGVELAALTQRARVESTVTASTSAGKVEEVMRIAFADARRFYESSPHAETLEPDEVAERVNDRVFRPMVRDLIAEGVAAGEFAVPDVESAAAFAMAVGMHAVSMIRDDTSARPEDAAVEAMLRMLGARERGGSR